MTRPSPRFYRTAGKGSLILMDTPFFSGFTTRNGGVSLGNHRSFNLYSGRGDSEDNVEKNWEIFRRCTSFQGTIVLPRQIHSANVSDIDGMEITGKKVVIEESDGLFFSRNDIMAGVMFADCLPVLLWGGNYKAVVHAGWRGMVKGIIKNAIELFNKMGIAAGGINAALGPAIGAEKYEVGKEVESAFKKAALGDAIEYKDRKIHVSLQKGAIINLSELGVSNIKFNEYCTFRDRSLFYSYRRDGENCGEMFLFCSGRKK